ncbi:YdcF family protein [Microbispora rosea]|uniref:YdcF family protein n=1 Tax=Microbispora rosea TaxID=58117 RepID=UPI0018CC2AB1
MDQSWTRPRGLVLGQAPTPPPAVSRFPRGEAVHYKEHATKLGVPGDAILVEPRVTSTGENVTNTRALLEQRGVAVASAVLVSRPYQQ